jgi:hypothetical protein
VTLQIVASLTDDTRSVNYDRNTFIIQATGLVNLAMQDVASYSACKIEKDLSLLAKESSYKCKRLYKIVQWTRCFKTFYGSNLQMFVVS